MSRTRRLRPAASPRRGVSTLELIIGLPILIILLLAIVEFGLIMSKLQQVALASRTGAAVAAQQSSFNVAAIKNQVDRQLATAGIMAPSCEVLLQHNVEVGSPTTLSSGSGTCSCTSPSTPALPSSSVVPDGCVRVTVCIALSALTPDLLNTLGLSLSGKVVQQTTTLAFQGHP